MATYHDVQRRMPNGRPAPFQVVVSGPVGTVYDGGMEWMARDEFDAWVKLAGRTKGAATGETITLFAHGEVVAEYKGAM